MELPVASLLCILSSQQMKGKGLRVLLSWQSAHPKTLVKNMVIISEYKAERNIEERDTEKLHIRAHAFTMMIEIRAMIPPGC